MYSSQFNCLKTETMKQSVCYGRIENGAVVHRNPLHQLHCTHLPAVIGSDGTMSYYQNDKLHLPLIRDAEITLRQMVCITKAMMDPERMDSLMLQQKLCYNKSSYSLLIIHNREEAQKLYDLTDEEKEHMIIAFCDEDLNLHRPIYPALTIGNKRSYYYLHGVLHNEFGPAIKDNHLTGYYLLGYPHRAVGPAKEYATGKYYYRYGELHRVWGLPWTLGTCGQATFTAIATAIR